MAGERPWRGFPRSSRLTRARDFERVFRRARRSTSKGLLVLARDNGAVRPRLGLAISRRVAKSSVHRNRIKRLIRESFRVHQETLHGLDVVVVCRPGITALDDTAMRETLTRHWLSVSRCSSPA